MIIQSPKNFEVILRKIIEPQMTFGQTPIDQIKIDMRARDEIPKLLLGLQHIYCVKELRQKVFDILETMIPDNVDSKNGRPGMELWKIFVMGTIRLNCNWDYDKLQDIVNNHKTIRHVITSYSIHYTKLYDPAFGQQPLQSLCCHR